MLVLRLLTVYFGTAAGAIFLANRFVSPVSRRTGVLLAFGPFLLVGKALVTGGVLAPLDITYITSPLAAHAEEQGTQITQTPILSDVVYQMIPFRKAVRDAAKHLRLPLWNRTVLNGEPLLALQQPAALYPATWIGFLLPLAQAWTFEMAMRYFLALLCAFLFLRELGCRDVAALLGGVGFAFCDYLVFYLGWAHAPAAAPFPLLLLGLRRIATDPGRRAAAITVVALLLIISSGHPETLLHSVAAGGIWFLFELFQVDPVRRRRAILVSLAAGALTLGLAAILLIPLAEALPRTMEDFFRHAIFAKSPKSVPLPEALRHVRMNVQPYAFGFAGHGRIPPGFLEPQCYAGSMLWPFALAGLFSRRREKWALLAIGLLGALIGASFPIAADALGKLPLFDIGLNQRMVFLGAFATAALAGLGAEWLLSEGRRGIAIGASLAGAAVAVLVWSTGKSGYPEVGLSPEFFHTRMLYGAIPLGAAALLWLAVPRRRLGIAVAGCLLFLLVQRQLEDGDVYPTYPSAAFYPPLDVLEKIPRAAPYRFTAVGIDFIPNIASLYDLEDVRGYEAMTFRPLFETFHLWCVHQPVWFNRVDDPTTPFLSFLNVRWVLLAPGAARPPGWPVVSSGPEGTLVENPAVLPRAFAPRSYRAEPDQTRRLSLLEGIRDFREQGVVGEGPATVGDGWQVNGRALVSIAKYLPQGIRLSIDAADSALIATSMTAWPGWKLSIDGRRAPTVSYNHAFVGFRVPGGKHEVVLTYLPDSFLAGAAISLVSLALSLFLLLRRRPSLVPR